MAGRHIGRIRFKRIKISRKSDGVVQDIDEDGFRAKLTGTMPVQLTLEGDLDMPSAPPLAELLDVVARSGAVDVVLDAANLTFIDSQGLNVLLQARRGGLRFQLRSVSNQMATVLDLGGVADLFPTEVS